MARPKCETAFVIWLEAHAGHLSMSRHRLYSGDIAHSNDKGFRLWHIKHSLYLGNSRLHLSNCVGNKSRYPKLGQIEPAPPSQCTRWMIGEQETLLQLYPCPMANHTS